MPRDESSNRAAPTGDSDWLTLGQAAKFLGVAQSTIRRWSDEGRVPAFYTPGGHRRYRQADLDRFLESSGPNAATVATPPVVLIVDNDERIREYVRVNLEMEGYSVREAGNAEEGLRVLDESTPALVLLDVMMPGVDGWDTASARSRWSCSAGRSTSGRPTRPPTAARRASSGSPSTRRS
jgi:excisionase family DNA binding protein